MLEADAELQASGSSKGVKAKAKAAANRALAKIKKGKAAKGDSDDDASSDEYVSPAKKRKTLIKKTGSAVVKYDTSSPRAWARGAATDDRSHALGCRAAAADDDDIKPSPPKKARVAIASSTKPTAVKPADDSESGKRCRPCQR